jgi:hypothetical protein
MASIPSDQSNADTGPAMQVEMVDLGGAELELVSQVSDEWPYERSLLLQGVHVAEPQVELDRTEPHGHRGSLGHGRKLTYTSASCALRLQQPAHREGNERARRLPTPVNRRSIWIVSMV